MDKAAAVYEKIKNTHTSQAIDQLWHEWMDRPAPKGVRKETYKPMEKRAEVEEVESYFPKCKFF